MRASAIAAGFAVILAASVQGQLRPVPLRGVIFDSLRGQPVRDAAVSIAGRPQVIMTDARGRFQFDSVEPGVHRIVAQHPILDSIGFSGLTAHASVAEGSNEVRLAIPSFATLWRLSCRGKAPKDSGIVYGTVRDLSGKPVAHALVDLTWYDVALDERHRLRGRQWQFETRSNEDGEYAACGVALDLGLDLQAKSDARETGVIGLPALTTRVQRHDLLLGASPREPSPGLGTVTGTVTDPAGLPLADARVLIDSLPEVRTRDDGTFIVPAVPSGTRGVEVRAIGAAPVNFAVDVLPGAVANVAATARMAVSLAPVETRAERNVRILTTEFNERRRLGLGYLRDSTEIIRYDQFLNVFRDVPSLNVQYRTPTLRITMPDGVGGQCAPRVIIDGGEAEFGHLIDLESKEVAALEVYVRVSEVPPRFAPIGIQNQCGIIIVWTKYGMRNR